MNCRRSEELWTDFLEGALAPPLEHELVQHFDACETCANLFSTFRDVVNGLHAFAVPMAPETMTARILARSQPWLRNARRDDVGYTAPSPRLIAAASWLAAAAVFLMVVVWRPPEIVSDWSRKTSQTAHQVYSFGVRTYHQTERWLEDLNVLRMTVGVAFEDQLDRLNEQLRTLEEAGRRSRDDDDEQSRDGVAPADASSVRASTSTMPTDGVAEATSRGPASRPSVPVGPTLSQLRRASPKPKAEAGGRAVPHSAASLSSGGLAHAKRGRTATHAGPHSTD